VGQIWDSYGSHPDGVGGANFVLQIIAIRPLVTALENKRGCFPSISDTIYTIFLRIF
jgi:hypothetical protein